MSIFTDNTPSRTPQPAAFALQPTFCSYSLVSIGVYKNAFPFFTVALGRPLGTGLPGIVILYFMFISYLLSMFIFEPHLGHSFIFLISQYPQNKHQDTYFGKKRSSIRFNIT